VDARKKEVAFEEGGGVCLLERLSERKRKKGMLVVGGWGVGGLSKRRIRKGKTGRTLGKEIVTLRRRRWRYRLFLLNMAVGEGGTWTRNGKEVRAVIYKNSMEGASWGRLFFPGEEGVKGVGRTVDQSFLWRGKIKRSHEGGSL